MKQATFAVIAAAGTGSRMNSGAVSKVLLPLADGRTSFEHSLRQLCASGTISGVVVATRTEDIPAIRKVVEGSVPEGTEVLVVAGGASRQESVYNALEAIVGKASHVLIHDAARPFCSVEAIVRVYEAARSSGAAILALPAKASLKRVTAAQVSESLPRAEIWEAQTPQVFALATILQAHIQARQDEYTGTDDSELVERIGITVTVVLGEESNIKLTTPFDMRLAELLLSTKSE